MTMTRMFFVVRHHHGADGPNDNFFFVVGRNEHGDAGLIIRCGVVLSFAEAVDDGEDAYKDEARAHKHVANEEDAHDEVAEEAVEEEGDGVGAGLPALARRQGRHHLSASLADEFGDGDDLVAAVAERLNQHRKRLYGDGAVAPSIVQEDDGALVPRVRLHVLDLLEDAVDDLLWGLARVLVPVIGVDLVADDGVAEILDAIYRGGLVVGVGFLVDRVWRAEVERLHA